MKPNKVNIKINQNIKNNSGTVVGIMEGNVSSRSVCDIYNNEVQISWLHLSDLHLGCDIYNETVVIEKLLIDID